MADAAKKQTLFSRMTKNSDLALTFGFFGIVVLLVIPVATPILDILLALSIGISLLILMIVIYIKDPSEFSVFPVILLAVTLFRLGLNVASTRLILLDGYAGHVIDSFGNFVVQGNYVVGAVVFLILIVINFMVITKGAGRIAEVAARFTLDSLPGKQMSIDAELNAGIIDERVATQRRLKLQKEADFYGAMDGASKFVRGDAVAGILITLINVVGGISIGVFQKNLPLMEALEKYTLLSIGDGLVSQVPALIVSVGAGILITRTAEGVSLGDQVGKQFRVYPRAMGVAAAMLYAFVLLPGMPAIPFLILGSICAYLARMLKKHAKDWEDEAAVEKAKAASGGSESEEAIAAEAAAAAKPGSREDLQKMIQVEVFSLELGFGLVAMADKKQNGDLLERITGVRQKVARELGIILPAISVRDNLELEANDYRFLLRGKELTRGSLVANRWLAMNVSGSDFQLKGVPTVEPVFNLDAIWIQDEERKNAENNGYTVVDAPSVLITHLTEVIRDNAHLLFEREDTQKLIDILKEKNPTLVSELLPDKVTVGLIQRVIQNLLQERVSIKNLGLILETIADFAEITKNPDELSEQVRRRMGPYFIGDYEYEPNKVYAITLDPRLEQVLLNRIKRTQYEIAIMMDPRLTQQMLAEMTPRLNDMVEKGYDPIIVTTMELRLAFRRFFEPTFSRLVVLSYQELPNKTHVQNYGVISVPLGNDNSVGVSQEAQLAPA